jgi:hypothetical protein
LFGFTAFAFTTANDRFAYTEGMLIKDRGSAGDESVIAKGPGRGSRASQPGRSTVVRAFCGAAPGDLRVGDVSGINVPAGFRDVKGSANHDREHDRRDYEAVHL